MNKREGSKSPRLVFPGSIGTYVLALALLAIGLLMFVYLVTATPQPLGHVQADPGRLVQVFQAERSVHQTVITAYGTSRAGTEWKAIAEVSGQAIEVHELFALGALLPEGTVVVRVDPADYEMDARRYEAEVRSREAALREIVQTKNNLAELLKLSERQFELAATELERIRSFFEKELETSKAVDDAEIAYLNHFKPVQDLRNSLALIPIQHSRLQALLDLAKVRLDQAELRLTKTAIKLPFAARCASKTVEKDQYVSAGEQLGTFHSVDKAEVWALVDIRKSRVLFPEGIGSDLLNDLGRPQRDRETLQLSAEIRWASSDMPVVWEGKVVRVASSLDERTRTVRVIVEVPEPYKDMQLGVRPPLLPDVFCHVTIYGATLKDVVVIPRDCLHDDRLYVVRNNRLHISPIKTLVIEDDLVVIRDGVAAGDLVVLTDLFPAVEGMPLRGHVVPNPVRPRSPRSRSNADPSPVSREAETSER